MPDGVTVTTQPPVPRVPLYSETRAPVSCWDPASSTSKQFRIAEHANLQFRAEFFNLLNHPQFQGLAPSTGTGGATAFLPQPLTAGASIISSTSINPRVVQLGLKLLF
jgi:hypothetical protein